MAMLDFGPLSTHLGYMLHRVDAAFMARIATDLSELGVTPARATAVVYVALHEGCDQMALGSALGINRASTMKAVNDLVALGAVERRAGRDRRSNALHLTAHGNALRAEIERITEHTNRTNFSVLSADEEAALRAILAKLRREDGEEHEEDRTSPSPAKPMMMRRVK